MQVTNLNYTVALLFKESNDEYQLKSGANTIGRSRSNTINIKDCKYLSRKHCTIYFNDLNLSITNNSIKGYTKITRRNEIIYLKHNQSSSLYMGDTIRIAQVTVVLKYKKLLDINSFSNIGNSNLNNNNNSSSENNNNNISDINNNSGGGSKAINIENSSISKSSENFLNVPQNSPNINHSNPFSLFSKMNNNNSNVDSAEMLSLGPLTSISYIAPLSIATETKVKKLPRASSSSINSLFSSLSINQDQSSQQQPKQSSNGSIRKKHVKKTKMHKTDKLNSLFNKFSIGSTNEGYSIDEADIDNNKRFKIIFNNENHNCNNNSLINNDDNPINNHSISDQDDNISLEIHQKLDRSNSI